MTHWLSAHALDIALSLSIATALLRALSRVLAPYPRARAVVEAIAALSPDVVRAVMQLASLRSPAVVPPSVGPLAPPPDQGGFVEGGAMLGVCVLALAASLACSGCPVVREIAMRAAPGVPDPVGCVAGVQRCADGVPVVCSATGREWAALPRSASGEQRTCAPGVCVVSDGVAHCGAL